MTSSFISFALALVVAMQVTSEPDDKTTQEHSDAKAVVETETDVKDREEASRRPRISRPEPQRREGRPRFVPRRSPRGAADEAPRIDDSGKRRQTTPRSQSGKRETVLIQLNHLPAVDAAETIEKWLASEAKSNGQVAATVVAVAITNDLVVSGSAEQLEIIRGVVDELDRPVRQIRVKALLAELNLVAAPQIPTGQAAALVSKGDMSKIVAELKERGGLRVLATPELLATDNQPAFLQFGSRVPRVTGGSVSSRGRTNQVTLENVGTVLAVTGRVTEDDFVTLEIDLERSHLGSEDEGTPVATSEDGPTVHAPQVKTLTLQTTVSLRSGQTVLLGGMVYRTEERWGELLLLLQPEIIQPGDGQPDDY